MKKELIFLSFFFLNYRLKLSTFHRTYILFIFEKLRIASRMKFHRHRDSICPQEGAQQASRAVWINSGLKRRRILRFSTREALIRAISIRECVAVDNRFAVTCNDHGHETVRGGALSAWNVDEVNERFKLAFRYSRNDLFARRYCAPLRQHSVDETTHIISRTVRYFSGLHIVTSPPPSPVSEFNKRGGCRLLSLARARETIDGRL